MSPARETAAAADGVPLAVTRFPATAPAWATMVFGNAMGVRQDFYAPFARYLASRGIHVLTFDYRGSGFSRRGSPARLEADVMDWALKDLDAMLLQAREAAPGLPLAFVGHSLGGQLLGVLPHGGEVSAAITITAGSGWYRFNERMWLQVRLLWFIAMPLLTPAFGYFPGKALRIVGDLPAGVARQWRRWCLDPDYLLCEGSAVRESFARVTMPMLAYSFEDDAMITRAAVANLHGFYRNAAVEFRHVAPRDVGQERIGHLGFFCVRAQANLWPACVDWLRQQLPAGMQ